MPDLNLLQQAISDAKKAKELTQRVVENKILERLSPKVRDIVYKLVEQQEGLEDPMGDIPTDMGNPMDALASGTSTGNDPAIDEFLKDLDPKEVDAVITPAIGEAGLQCTDQPEKASENGGDEIHRMSIDSLIGTSDQQSMMTESLVKDFIKLLGDKVSKDEIIMTEETKPEGAYFSSYEQMAEMVSNLVEELVFNYNLVGTGSMRASNSQIDEWEKIYKVLQMAKEEEGKEESHFEVQQKLQEELQQKLEKEKENYTSVVSKNNLIVEQYNTLRDKALSIKLENDKKSLIINLYENINMTDKHKRSLITGIREAKTLTEAKAIYSTVSAVTTPASNSQYDATVKQNRGKLEEIKVTMGRRTNLQEEQEPKHGGRAKTDSGSVLEGSMDRSRLLKLARITEEN